MTWTLDGVFGLLPYALVFGAVVGLIVGAFSDFGGR